ncbi:MAG: STAS domain-containing protein [Acidobacteriota bacterium]|nr:MAG: STAS domain-containing protein [Acidobacteriota bacterium]
MGPEAYIIEPSKISEPAEAWSVRIEGRVTLEEVPNLRRDLLGLVEKASTSRLVLELGEVATIDTSGAAVLVEAFLAGRARGMQVLFCRASEAVLRLFRLAGFEEVLGHCCADVEEVRRRLAG